MPHLQQPKRTWFFASLMLTTGLAGALALYAELDLLLAWILAANLIAMPIWAYDKWIAGRGGARIPESTLHALAAIGATPASFACMSFLRHKTQKKNFYWLYSGFLLAQVALLLVFHWEGVRSWFGR